MKAKRRWSPGEIEITHVRGSGPGGQNRNKRMSGVRVRHLATGLTVLSTERRSQSQNLANALRRLEDRVEKASYRPPDRFATKPTRSSKTKRLETKRLLSTKKRQRHRIIDGD